MTIDKAVDPMGKQAIDPEPMTRREELLNIAMKLFAEQGVAKTTVRDIADAAGMLSGSLYHHFSSKDQMIAEALGTGLVANAAANQTVIETAPDEVTALARLIIGAVRWVGREPDVVTILTNDKAYIRDNPNLSATEDSRQVSRVAWIKLIDDGIAKGLFRPIRNTDVLVRSIFDGIFGTSRWMYGGQAPREVAADLADFYVRALLADGHHYDVETGVLTTPS